MQAPPELMGSFYLGAEYDLDAGQRTATPVHYDARDLTTHAICVGMTGSGKTGLCVALLEEAAIDSVPALIIDPKGGMTNLLLQFPALRAEDFEPWVNPDDARRQEQTPAEYAGTVATLWRERLAGWGMTPSRIRLLQTSADFCVYTPGSDAGLPISILSSLGAPGLDFDAHAESLRERISGTVAALLGLVGIKGDPLRSRQAILLANIFEHYWRQERNLDLATLITAIQDPPVRQMGVFDVDTFYPRPERFELAMTFNNLIAAPSFQSWLTGEALDIDRLLYTEAGQPRHSIFYLAHLSDSERMFFVTLLLENVVAWMHRQSGTSSLRALLYFDEIFGFFPAIAEPPSKRPLLKLLKQARAAGLGCILGAQNPIDIDYKGLTNAGTWFIGKLQAERDKERVLGGLKGALNTLDGQAGARQPDYEALIGRLGPRQFLMHDVHRPGPAVLYTRWAMSYLRGPLTKPQVEKLMAGRKPAQPAPPPVHQAAPRAMQAEPAPILETAQDFALGAAQDFALGANQDFALGTTQDFALGANQDFALGANQDFALGADQDFALGANQDFAATPPALPPSAPQVFLPLHLDEKGAFRQLSQQAGRQLELQALALIYEPAIVGGANVRFVDRKRQVNEQREKVLLAPPPDDFGSVNWELAEALPLSMAELTGARAPAPADVGPFFAPVPESANSERELKDIARGLSDWLYHNSQLTLTVHPELDIFQEPGERERSFKMRLRQAARERRDTEVDKLSQKYVTRIERLEARLRKHERNLVSDKAEYDARKRETRLTMGETMLSFLMGRRRTRTVSAIATKQRLADRAKLEIEETRDEIAELETEIAELEAELEAAAQEITQKWADLLDDLTTEAVHPRRTDVDVRLVALAWLPSWRITYHDGVRSHTATMAAYAIAEMA